MPLGRVYGYDSLHYEAHNLRLALAAAWFPRWLFSLRRRFDAMRQGEAKPSVQANISGRQLARNTALNLPGRIVPLPAAVAAMPYVLRHLEGSVLGFWRRPGSRWFILRCLAWAVVSAETFVTGGICATLRWRGLNPGASRTEPAGETL